MLRVTIQSLPVSSCRGNAVADNHKEPFSALSCNFAQNTHPSALHMIGKGRSYLTCPLYGPIFSSCAAFFRPMLR